jgi:hypothetical protein
MTKKLDELANLWEKTKDPKYKDLWYKLVKEFADGRTSTLSRDVDTPGWKTSKRNTRVSKTSNAVGVSGIWRCP